MDSFYILFLGFLIGLRHALEADHVAAVASLSAGTVSVRDGVRMGITWGLGHTLTLFVFGACVLALDTMIPEHLALALEFAVGLMLVGLGGMVVQEFFQNQIHFHKHQHADGKVHFHFHSHKGSGKDHSKDPHHHTHSKKFPVRALMVGMMHGMAGSSALILLTVDSVSSPLLGMTYILLFGIGSIAGMGLLSLIIAVPLKRSESAMNRTYHSLKGAIGLATVIVGLTIIFKIGLSTKFSFL